MILWVIFYANIVLDNSAINYEWFMQGVAVVAGLLTLAYAHTRQKHQQNQWIYWTTSLVKTDDN